MRLANGAKSGSTLLNGSASEDGRLTHSPWVQLEQLEQLWGCVPGMCISWCIEKLVSDQLPLDCPGSVYQQVHQSEEA